ncbi:hypothetical protein BC835DRAFT_1454372 [Cytidiella melzeri]|nr:hypothetical protein BC835DRAFT_1454372 [Cytidiella melzeri]
MGPKEVKELQDDKCRTARRERTCGCARSRTLRHQDSSYSQERQDTKKRDAQYIRELEEQARKDVQHIRTLERLVDERNKTFAALRLEIGGFRPPNAGPGVAHILEEQIVPSPTDVPSCTMAWDPYKLGSEDYGYGAPTEKAECKARRKQALASGRCWVLWTVSKLSHSMLPLPQQKGKERDVARPLQEQLAVWNEAGGSPWASVGKITTPLSSRIADEVSPKPTAFWLPTTCRSETRLVP